MDQTLVEMRDPIRSPRDSSGNSLRPFCTAQKPSCGFRFSQDTDHRRKHNDLRACNPNKWRSVIKPQ